MHPPSLVIGVVHKKAIVIQNVKNVAVHVKLNPSFHVSGTKYLGGERMEECERCGKNPIAFLTAIPVKGVDICEECGKEFFEKVMTKEPRDTPMKVCVDFYEFLCDLAGIPKERRITYGIEDVYKTFWDGIKCIVNEEAYLAFFEHNI